MADTTTNKSSHNPGLITKIKNRIVKIWEYFDIGVWHETRSNLKINTIKTISLSVKSFLNTDLQGKACAMAFRTMLALVPALALVFAIGRGFGFQTILEDELYSMMPTQKQVIADTLQYVDSYLNTASEGIFVGIGLIFLLYTLISLLSNVEDTFNSIWGVPTGRSLWRKITDYTAMLLILPILMICASGLTIFLSSTLQAVFHFSFMTPVISALLEFASWAFLWLFFAAAYMLIPNIKVSFKNALLAGVLAGTGFRILEWIFVSGQIYVTRYNAIYGSFAFFPLLLLWLQLTWLICLSGAIFCYSSQNIFQFTFSNEIKAISPNYRTKITLAITAVIVQSFCRHEQIPTVQSIARKYGIPSRLTSDIINNLIKAGIVNRVVVDTKKEIYGFTPAVEPEIITVKYVINALNSQGLEGFIPKFDESFSRIDSVMKQIEKDETGSEFNILLSDLKISNRDE